MTRNILKRSGSILAAGLVALTAYAAVQDSVSLKRKPKVGDTFEYKASANFTMAQGEIGFSQEQTVKITEVKPEGGFVQESTNKNTKITFGGAEQPGPPESKSTSEYGMDGLLKSIKADTPADAASWRIANLHAFKRPDGDVKVGDEIKFEIPADSKRETPAMKAVFKVAGKEKVKDWDTVKLTYSTEETEGDMKSSIKGTIWLSTADGSMVKTDETWKDVQPQGAPALSGKYTVERTK